MMTNLLDMFPRIFIMIFVALSVVVLVTKFVAVSADAGVAERSIMVNRLLFSPSCLAYTDPVDGRPYPGVVDMARFSNETLDACMAFGSFDDNLAANLTLTYLGPGTKNQSYYQDQTYMILRPRAAKTGPGGATILDETRYVLVMDSGVMRKATLRVEMATPNS